MRSSKPRPRSKNNRNNNNRSAANVLNRVFDSSGPEGKVRGTPQQVIEKYQQLTRDAQLSGDRVAAENFQQHAEHYMRLQADAQREIDLRQEQQRSMTCRRLGRAGALSSLICSESFRGCAELSTACHPLEKRRDR